MARSGVDTYALSSRSSAATRTERLAEIRLATQLGRLRYLHWVTRLILLGKNLKGFDSVV